MRMRGTKRGHRFGQFYAKLCCACATKRGFDLTIANHGGACGNCLARNIESLGSHTHLHLDTLCAKLSNMIYESQEESQTSVQDRLKEHFEITAHNKLGGDTEEDANGQKVEKIGPCFLVLRALFDLPLIIVVFRGSQSVVDWLVNGSSTVVGIGREGQKFNVHNGMNGRLGEVDDKTGLTIIDEILAGIETAKSAVGGANPTIVFTGHSLGGGLAIVCRCKLHFQGIAGPNVHTVTFGSPLVIASNPHEIEALQEMSKTTRNYVYNLDIFPRILFQQDPELVIEFLSSYIKENYPAYYSTGGIFGIGGKWTAVSNNQAAGDYGCAPKDDSSFKAAGNQLGRDANGRHAHDERALGIQFHASSPSSDTSMPSHRA